MTTEPAMQALSDTVNGMASDPPRYAPAPDAANPLRVLVTGGGTGGHTTPAVATIQALRAMASEDGSGLSGVQFAYVGSRTGMEGDIARGLGVEFVGIETGKLRRARSLIGLLSRANLRDMLRVPAGYLQALQAVRRLRPDVVLSTGGYVSVPGVLAAAALRIPIVAHEQTVQIGLANRISFRFAAKIAVSVDETLVALKPAERKRATVTGNPVRELIFNGSAARAVAEFQLQAADNDLPTAYVTGGAQGSRLLNQAVEGALPQLVEYCRIIHQCGNQEDFAALNAARERLSDTLQQRYAVARFVGSEIGDVYALADLIIGRSGAGTVTEACALGKACIFVPLVPTGGDEQTRNAARLADVGAAVIVPQGELSAETLISAALSLLADRSRLEAMGRSAHALAKPDAARALAELVRQAGRIE